MKDTHVAILAAALALSGCATVQQEVTPARCEAALEAATAAEEFARQLVAMGWQVERARFVADMLARGQVAIGLICSGALPATSVEQ